MNPSHELAIVTGASRGLGYEIARQLLAHGAQVLTIARRPNAALEDVAHSGGATLVQWPLDLAHSTGAAARLETWLHGVDGRAVSRVALINNAGLIGHVGGLEHMSADALAAVLRVNLEAPMALTGAFLRATASWPCPRRILNISSGAGRHAIGGWSAYCASKAGLDHFSRVTALDEAAKSNGANGTNGARIVALAPGMIDTDMQGELRNADPTEFPSQHRFLDAHATGQLNSASDAAAGVIAFLNRPDFGADAVADVRNPPPPAP